MLSCVLVAILIVFVSPSSTQPIPGCPFYGCRPTGSFSFQMDIPKNPQIIWNRTISVGETPHSDLGCVGNSYTVLCPVINEDHRSYVSIDPATGNIKWIEKNLKDPPLPLLDIYGDVIACDGKTLTMIKANGTVVKPVIKFMAKINSTYSLQIADDNIFLIAADDGFLVTYDGDGVVHASVWMNRTDEGAYAPIATPVIKGIRAYILTKWKPFNGSELVPPRYRLYAFDIRAVMVNRIKYAWSYDFPPKLQKESSENTNDISASVLSYQDKVFIILPDGRQSSTLWGFKDLTNNSQLNFVQEKPYKYLAINEGDIQSKFNLVQKYPRLSRYRHKTWNAFHGSVLKDPTNFLWSVYHNVFNGTDCIHRLDTDTGEIVQPVIKLADILNINKANVTSNLMIAASPSRNDISETLLFGVNITQLNPLNGNSDHHQAIVAIDIKGDVAMLRWKVPLYYPVVTGQIIGINTENNVHSNDINVDAQSNSSYLIAYGHVPGSSKFGGVLFALQDK